MSRKGLPRNAGITDLIEHQQNTYIFVSNGTFADLDPSEGKTIINNSYLNKIGEHDLYVAV